MTATGTGAKPAKADATLEPKIRSTEDKPRDPHTTAELPRSSMMLRSAAMTFPSPNRISADSSARSRAQASTKTLRPFRSSSAGGARQESAGCATAEARGGSTTWSTSSPTPRSRAQPRANRAAASLLGARSVHNNTGPGEGGSAKSGGTTTTGAGRLRSSRRLTRPRRTHTSSLALARRPTMRPRLWVCSRAPSRPSSAVVASMSPWSTKTVLGSRTSSCWRSSSKR